MRTNTTLKIQTPAMELGRPLAPWTYSDPDLAREEYERVIRASWQFVCHESEVAAPGDYATLDLWHDSILVLRGADDVLRAFQNACRHRAMPLLSGQGQCKGRVTCPYHAWSYRLDGSLAAVAAEHTFPGIDKAELGLRQLGLEVFHGLVFARITGDGPGVAEQWGALAQLIEPYRVAEMVRSPRDNSQTWKANWKVAIDNNQENYHVPVGHPGYHRLLDNEMTGQSSGNGVGLSRSTIRAKPSTNWSERNYQRLLPAAELGLDAESAGSWLFSGMQPNMGINFYPDSMDVFQILPLGPELTHARNAIYVRPGANRAARAVQWLNYRINRQVGSEDRYLCESVQRGLASHGYQPGPFSEYESGVAEFHDMIRAACPSAGLPERPKAAR